MSSQWGEIADRVAAGERIDDEQLDTLASTRDLLTVGMLADEARRRRRGDRVTFVRVFDVPWDAEAVPTVPDIAGEVRITGAPPSIEAAVTAVQRVAGATGVAITGFSLRGLEALCGGDAADLARALAQLQAAGLAAVAELPADGARAPEDTLEIAARVGLPVSRVTVHRASDAERLQVVRRVAAWRVPAHTVRAFAPLPRTIAEPQPATGYDDVRQVALARLVVNNIDSIQVDWTLCGPKLAQVALTFGADDVDAVPAVESGKLGARRTVLEEIRRNIRAAAFISVERSGSFEMLTR